MTTAVRPPPRLIVLSPFFPPNIGGVETHLSDYAAALERLELATTVVTLQPLTDGGVAPAIETHGSVTIRRHRWPQGSYFHWFERWMPLQFLYLFPIMLVALLREVARLGHRNVSAIHGHGLAAGMAAKITGRLLGIRAVTSIHAIYEAQPGSVKACAIRAAVGGADAVLCLSDASMHEMKKLGVDQRKVHRFEYWIDVRRFCYAGMDDARRTLRWPMEQVILLFIGRLIEKKGADILCEAVAAFPAAQLYIIGDGPERAHLAARRPANVEFLGAMPNTDVPLYIQAADAVFVPSKYEEGYGRIAMESLACGAQVCASDVGGLPEALGGRGLLFAPTVDGIESAIEHVIRNATVERSRRRIRADEAAERFGESNVSLILSALAS